MIERRSQAHFASSRLACGLALYLCILMGPVYSAEVFEEETRALAIRREIATAQISVDGEYDLYIPPKTSPEFSRQVQLTCFVDHRMLRNDETYSGSSKNRIAEPYRVISSFGDTMHISYSTQVLPNGNRLATEARPVGAVDPVTALKIDARVIGMSANSIFNLSRKRIDSVVGRPDRKESSIRSEILEGDDCRVVSYTRNDDVRAEIWIAVSKGYGVKKLMLTFSADGKEYVDLIENDLEKDINSELWFPKSYHYRREIDGQLNEEEFAKIDVHSINEQLPAHTFDFKGIGVPIGTEVTIFDSSGVSQKIWDGGKLEAVVHESALPQAEWTVQRQALMAVTILAILTTTTLMIMRGRGIANS